MSDSAAACLIVREGRDVLTEALAAALRDRGRSCELLSASDLARSAIEVDSDAVRVDGVLIDALLFHASPRACFVGGFTAEDSEFCNQETSALWLAIHHHPSVRAVNAVDAEIWYCRSEWATWHRRFRGCSVSGHMTVGRAAEGVPWFPWGGGVARLPGSLAARALLAAQPETPALRRVTICYGEALGARDEPIERAARVLSRRGINFAEIWVGRDGRVLQCTAFPRPTDGEAPTIARRLAEGIDATRDRR